MRQEDFKKKLVEIARLARAIKNAAEALANLSRALDRPSVKLAIEIDKFCREIDKKYKTRDFNDRVSQLTYRK